jgi:hypothetical protein
MRCKTTKWDIYVNGQLKQSIKLNNVVKQNNGDIFITDGKSSEGGEQSTKGFDGHLSNLIYNPYALTTGEIMNIFLKGPNLTHNKNNKRETENSYNGGIDNNFLGSGWY